MKYIILLSSCLISISALAQKRFLALDSTQIWINTIGTENREEGQPLIVFESGHGTPMDNWDRVLAGVSKLAPVFCYDRPGIGQSAANETMPSIKNVADQLVGLLQQLKLEPPYILVGHSLGGLYARGFAIYYPEMLAGLVLIDPADFTENHQNRRDHYDVLHWEAAKVDSLIQTFIDKRISRNEQAPEAIKKEGQVLEGLRENEFSTITKSTLPNIPVHILTGGRFDKPQKYRSKEYDEEALFRSKMKHRVQRWTEVIQSVEKGMIFYSGDAGHFVHYDDPELLISSIRMVLQDYALLQQKAGE